MVHSVSATERLPGDKVRTSSVVQHIDNTRVSESDRQIAKEHMRDADFVADLICRAAGNPLPRASELVVRAAPGEIAAASARLVN